MPNRTEPAPSVLAFGWLGGAAAWLVHLLAAYALGEFGCLSELARVRWLGISAIAWLLVTVTLAMLAVALGATWLAYRADRRLDAGVEDKTSSRRYLARSGWITSGVFAFIIAVEALPVLFLLASCGGGAP